MKAKIDHYIKTWKKKGYSNDIPDEVPERLATLNKAPSYKAICIAILKNDHNLKTLGYEGKKSKYYDILKKIELSQRPGYYDNRQLCFEFYNKN